MMQATFSPDNNKNLLGSTTLWGLTEVFLHGIWSCWKDKASLQSDKNANHLPGGWSWDPYPHLGCSMPSLPLMSWVEAELFLFCLPGRGAACPSLSWSQTVASWEKTVSISPRSMRGAWRQDRGLCFPWQFFPLCRNCYPHSSASSRELICAPTSLVVPGQAPPLTTHHQQQPRLQQREQLKGTHMFFFSSRAKRSCLESACPTPSIWDSRWWPSYSIKNPLAAPHSGKPLLLHEGKICSLPLSSFLRNLPCQSYRDIHFPTYPSPSKPRTEVCLHYLLQWGAYKTGPGSSRTGLESCIKPEVKTLPWGIGKYVRSRAKLLYSTQQGVD